MSKHPPASALLSLSEKSDRPLFIIGPGPSGLSLSPEKLPGNAVLVRMNMFFCEAKPLWGTHVHAYFWATEHGVLYEGLSDQIAQERYHIEAFFSPRDFIANDDPGNRSGQRAKKLFTPHADHWSIIARNPLLGRAMMGRPLPTQAFQALACCLVLGFREVHLIGIDLYADPERRYAFDYPDHIQSRLGQAHTQPGYELSEHDQAADLHFLQLMMACYPDARIYNASDVSPLRIILPDSYLLTGKDRVAAPLPKPDAQIDADQHALELELVYLKQRLCELESSRALKWLRRILRLIPIRR